MTRISEVPPAPFNNQPKRNVPQPKKKNLSFKITTCTSLHVSAAQSKSGEIDCNSKQKRENVTR